MSDPVERPFAPDASIPAAELVRQLMRHTLSVYATQDRFELLKMALALDPGNGLPYAHLACCLAGRDPASLYFTLPRLDWWSQEALRLAPDHPRSWWARAIYLERCNQLEEANLAKERAREFGLPEAAFWLRSTALLLSQDRLTGARDTLERALPLMASDPDSIRRVQLRRALFAWAMDLAQRDAFPEARQLALRACGIADRQPETPLRCVDLTSLYNAPINSPWIWRMAHNWDLAPLEKGVIGLAGTDFDVRGLIQFSRGSWAHYFRYDEWSKYYRVGVFGVQAEAAFRFEWPQQVSGIPVGQPCRRLHLLLGTHDQEPDGVVIANVTVHYADGQTNQIPIHYGTHVREWILEALEKLPDPDPRAAWSHRTHLGDVLQLFVRSWENPRPEIAIDRLDLQSTMTESAPFVVAITLDP